MEATKKVKEIVAVYNHEKDSNGKTTNENQKPPTSFWIRCSKTLGLMNDNKDDPRWNPTAITCAAVCFLLILIMVIQGGLSALDKKDEARFDEAKAVKVATETDKLLNIAEERHAKTLEFIKQKDKNLYDALPEEYKRFDSRSFNKSVLEKHEKEK